MGICNLFSFFCKKDEYSKLKAKSNCEIVEKDSVLLNETIYFKKLNAKEWQAIDSLKTQLAHSIVSQNLSFEDACKDNYVFDLIRLSWVDKSGALVINTEEELKGLSNGEICAQYVNELSRLALEANSFIVTVDDLKKK
jgi:hypothetical protein